MQMGDRSMAHGILILFIAVAVGGGGCGDEKKKKKSSNKDSVRAIEKRYKDDPEERAEKLIKLAKRAQKGKDMPKAEEAIEAAAKAAGKIRKAEPKARVFTELAAGQIYVGDKSAAKKSVGKALDAIDNIEDEPETQANLLIDLCKMLSKNDRADDAKEHLVTAEEKVEAIKEVEGKILVLSKVAAMFAEVGDKDEAKRVVASAMKVAETIEKPLNQASAMADIAAAQDAYDDKAAEKTFKEAVKIAKSIKVDYTQANALYNIASKMAGAGEKSAARKLLGEAQELATASKDESQRKVLLPKINKLLGKLEKSS